MLSGGSPPVRLAHAAGGCAACIRDRMVGEEELLVLLSVEVMTSTRGWFTGSRMRPWLQILKLRKKVKLPPMSFVVSLNVGSLLVG